MLVYKMLSVKNQILVAGDGLFFLEYATKSHEIYSTAPLSVTCIKRCVTEKRSDCGAL